MARSGRFWTGLATGVAVAALAVTGGVLLGVVQPTWKPPVWPETLRHRSLSEAEAAAARAAGSEDLYRFDISTGRRTIEVWAEVYAAGELVEPRAAEFTTALFPEASTAPTLWLRWDERRLAISLDLDGGWVGMDPPQPVLDATPLGGSVTTVVADAVPIVPGTEIGLVVIAAQTDGNAPPLDTLPTLLDDPSEAIDTYDHVVLIRCRFSDQRRP